MNKNKVRMQVVEESPFGIYVWFTGDNKIVADENGNYLSIQAMKGDEKKIELIRLAAKDCGIEDGRAVFMSGYRQVTDEEYAYQKQRMEWGLIPDELDLPAFKEEQAQLAAKKARGENIYDEID